METEERQVYLLPVEQQLVEMGLSTVDDRDQVEYMLREV